MEQRGQERDVGVPNSVDFSLPQINQEPPVKLPLSIPHDRRGNSTVSSRRRSSIFLPTQTLDPPPPPPPPPLSVSGLATNSVRYKECLKNHAASMGAHVVDGCGEFMPSGDDGLRCAACNCHRNFHRRNVQMPPHLQQHHHIATMVSFGGGAAAESSSDGAAAQPSKKRLRTKFSKDQKDRMHELATKLNWTIQKQDEQEVQEFCSQVGVRRHVFKVWMHNNKQAIKKRSMEI